MSAAEQTASFASSSIVVPLGAVLLLPAEHEVTRATESTAMPKRFLRIQAILILFAAAIVLPDLAVADERPPTLQIQEEVWALPLALPVLAYLVRPVGAGPFPLVIMNHGV